MAGEQIEIPLHVHPLVVLFDHEQQIAWAVPQANATPDGPISWWKTKEMVIAALKMALDKEEHELRVHRMQQLQKQEAAAVQAQIEAANKATFLRNHIERDGRR